METRTFLLVIGYSTRSVHPFHRWTPPRTAAGVWDLHHTLGRCPVMVSLEWEQTVIDALDPAIRQAEGSTRLARPDDRRR